MQQPIKNLKILLLVSDYTFAQLIKILLKKIGIQDVYFVKTSQEALSAHHNYEPDICLLEVDLKSGSISGIDIAEEIRKKDKYVGFIFLSNHLDNSLHKKASVLKLSNFLNKEVTLSKLQKTLQFSALQIENMKLSKQLMKSQSASNHTPALKQRNNAQVFFKIGDSFKGILTKNITLFYAENKLTYARVNNRNYPTTVQLKVLEEELVPEFLRCHKKYLINVDQIESIELKQGKVKIGDQLIPIGYAYRKSFLGNLNLLK